MELSLRLDGGYKSGRSGFTGAHPRFSTPRRVLLEAGNVKGEPSGVHRTNDGNLPYAEWPRAGELRAKSGVRRAGEP